MTSPCDTITVRWAVARRVPGGWSVTSTEFPWAVGTGPTVDAAVLAFGRAVWLGPAPESP